MSVGAGSATVEGAVRTTRLIALGLGAGPVLFLIPAYLFGMGGMDQAMRPLQIVAGALGLVAPAAGYHLFLAAKGRADADSALDGETRIRRFIQAFIVALAVSEGGALLAAVAYFLTGQPLTLLGVAAHLLIVGALWPSVERVQWFIQPAEPLEPGPEA
ncbi:hypothetical protein ABI59_06425 [Acidobacteria bacterium Mor1]|nr:hypothetical protein ABI59_06425 [Acidobacteria bacterium Mor1]